MTTRPLILIVDDESRIRRLVSEQLERSGFDVCLAHDGQQAIELFRLGTVEPDLVILDLMMPGLDGHDTLRALRAMSDVPVMILTARDFISDKRQTFEAGADDYLVKPFSMDELILRIGALLRRTQTSHSAAPAEQLQNGPLSLIPPQSSAFWHNERLTLTKREFNLLALLFKHRGQIVAYERLLQIGWMSDEGADISHLRVAMARIRKKLSLAGANPKILSSYTNVGYMLGDLSEYDIDYGDV